MRTAHTVLSSLWDTLAFLDVGEGALPKTSVLRHQIIARAVAFAAYGQGLDDDLAAARLGRIIDESSAGLFCLWGAEDEGAVLDFLAEIGLRAAAGAPRHVPEWLERQM